MKLHLPLRTKLLVWLLLNFLLLMGIAIVWSGGGGWQMLLSDSVRDRLFDIGQDIGGILSERAETEWSSTLRSDGQRLGVRFDCCSDRAGPSLPSLGPSRPPFDRDDDMPAGPPPFGERPRVPHDDGNPARRFTITHTASGYRVGIPILIGPGVRRHPATLEATASTLPALIRFLGLEHWFGLVLIAVGASILFWLPMLAYVTRGVLRITEATRRIAGGRFDVRVVPIGGDELGTLAEAVNSMAERLQHTQEMQRNFLADVAHETTSPLSRVQIALGLLEVRIAESERSLVADLQEDAQQMSDLLGELLLFSRADRLAANSAPVTRFSLKEMIETAIRNDDLQSRTQLHLAADFEIESHRPFLLRALSNLLRNAQRYGGADSVIDITVERAEMVVIRVRDHGPGVPEEAIARLGEPFYRPEAARSSATGGFGLGLAIVRRCILACGGTVSFSNRRDGRSGFEVALSFPGSAGTVAAA
jgi:two-component system sensor histidine kinase CpxA